MQPAIRVPFQSHAGDFLDRHIFLKGCSTGFPMWRWLFAGVLICLISLLVVFANLHADKRTGFLSKMSSNSKRP